MSTIPFRPRRFRSTVAYYARYRVPYPAALIDTVAARVGLLRGDGVLDLGCGPGVLGLAFARRDMQVVAMDPEPDMLAEASVAAAEAGVVITLKEGSSYDLGPDLGRFKLAVMGRSFHWMDRPATLEALDGLIEPGGAVALFHDRRIASTPNWHKVLESLGGEFAPGGSESRAARRSPDWAPHEAMLLQSAFAAVETTGQVLQRQLGIEDIVGRSYSMSVTSPEALGDRREEFEARLREQLLALAPDGRFTEIVGVEAILAFRPGEAAAASARAGRHTA